MTNPSPHQLYAEKLLKVYQQGKTRLLWGSALASIAFAVLLVDSSAPLPASLAWYSTVLAAIGLSAYTRQRLGKKRASERGGESLHRYLLLALLEGASWGALVLFWPQVEPGLRLLLVLFPCLMAMLATNRYALVPLILNYFLGASLVTLALGLLYVDWHEGRWIIFGLAITWAALRQEALRLCAEYGSNLDSRFRLAQQADTDPLTGLTNRRGLDVAIDQEWRRAARTNAPLSLIMIDIDFFKKFNDRYGHVAGDACLRRVAQALGSKVQRVGDCVARYGGEEFTVLLHFTVQTDAVVLSNKLRQAILDLRIEHADNATGFVTISVGGVTLIPDSKHTPTTIVQLADQALYQAKMQGRNQVAWVTVVD
jgi:diguanylate cyclase (GGDEF)-like protein